MRQLPLAFKEPPVSERLLPPQPPPEAAGAFGGIGGTERGLHQAGHSTALLCEIDPIATVVLRERFSGVQLHADVQSLEALPDIELLAAGFPCQDLSIAGQR